MINPNYKVPTAPSKQSHRNVTQSAQEKDRQAAAPFARIVKFKGALETM